MKEKKYEELKKGERGAIISICAYIFLSILKIVIGYTADSQALKADGLNNATDIVASIALLIGLRVSQKPPDQNHPYGHWKAETVASLIASFIMMVVGIQVLYEALKYIFQSQHTEAPNIIAAWTGMGSAIIMYFVYRYNKKLGEKINSEAVSAAAKDNLSDAWVSIGASIGIFGSQLHLPWLDPVTAVVVGALICRTAWGIFKDATLSLTDGYEEKRLEKYKKTAKTISGVEKVKKIQARKYGNNTVVDIIILVDPNLDIIDGHSIATDVENVLMNEHDVFGVHVHVEPME